jgi:4-hydroxythreonine-4-phosphate dehydrogenase
MGDPSGIGPEIILRSLAKTSIRRLASYIIVGDASVLQKTTAALSKSHKLLLKSIHIIPNSPSAPLGSGYSAKSFVDLSRTSEVSLLDLKNVPASSFSFGKESAIYGKASVEYIEKAYRLVEAGVADCLVTSPINKSSANKAGFEFPGHTEYLADLSGTNKFVMMLAGGPLRVSLVTRHIPISDVPKHLTSQNIADTIEITLKALKTDFNIAKPKVGVCALNPHSGEGGVFGNEEIRKISPAIGKFSNQHIIGPISADALFYDAYRGKFDALICLYHDQGLIPLKMIARDSGVNITLGLGFTRTSPDHGTAFDIAGKGKANSSSMEKAVQLAVSAVRNRKKHLKIQ